MSRADLPAVFALLVAVDLADDRDWAGEPADFEGEFDDPWSPPETHSILGLEPSGEPVVYARAFINPEPGDDSRAHLFYEIAPRWRGRGLEEPVFAWVEALGRRRLAAINGDCPGGRAQLLRMSIQDTMTERAAQLEARGYRAARYFYRMRRDLSEPIPDLPLPAGLALRPYTPGLSEPLRVAFNDAFADHWAFEAATPEDWPIFFTESAAFRPDLTLIACDGDEIAGLLIAKVQVQQNARLGLNEAMVAELGTRRPWRRRGLASALLARAMRAFKAAGFDHAVLGVDTENPSGALGLYERQGFKPVKRFVAYEKPL
jgi:ribosomal protein S18 acetylase RimI-like enzyme